MCYEKYHKMILFLDGAKCPLDSLLMENQIDIKSVNLIFEIGLSTIRERLVKGVFLFEVLQ